MFSQGLSLQRQRAAVQSLQRGTGVSTRAIDEATRRPHPGSDVKDDLQSSSRVRFQLAIAKLVRVIGVELTTGVDGEYGLHDDTNRCVVHCMRRIRPTCGSVY